MQISVPFSDRSIYQSDPTKRARSIPRPIISVRLANGEIDLPTVPVQQALVDTGAARCAFPYSIAEDLQLELTPTSNVGIGGKEYPAAIAAVDFRIECSFENRWGFELEFRSKCFFAQGYKRSYSLLGRHYFLNFFLTYVFEPFATSGLETEELNKPTGCIRMTTSEAFEGKLICHRLVEED